MYRSTIQLIALLPLLTSFQAYAAPVSAELEVRGEIEQVKILKLNARQYSFPCEADELLAKTHSGESVCVSTVFIRADNSRYDMIRSPKQENLAARTPGKHRKPPRQYNDEDNENLEARTPGKHRKPPRQYNEGENENLEARTPGKHRKPPRQYNEGENENLEARTPGKHRKPPRQYTDEDNENLEARTPGKHRKPPRQYNEQENENLEARTPGKHRKPPRQVGEQGIDVPYWIGNGDDDTALHYYTQPPPETSGEPAHHLSARFRKIFWPGYPTDEPTPSCPPGSHVVPAQNGEKEILCVYDQQEGSGSGTGEEVRVL